LLIPGLNDDPGELDRLAQWLSRISPDIPLHFSRYFPNYRLNLPPTPPATLLRARDIAREHLRYVYLGNLGGEGCNTDCPGCGQVVIDRLRQTSRLDTTGRCPGCGTPISICGRPLGDYI
jgi:pyruvate formate lyase activating enzyme